MKTSRSRIAVLFTLVLAFVCSIVLSVFSLASAQDEPVFESTELFMQEGASVRFAESSDEMGLRFVTAMFDDQYEALKGAVVAGDYADFKVGMVIIPKNYVDVEEITLASLFGVEGEKKYYWGEGDAPAGQEKIIHFEALNSKYELTQIKGLPGFVGLKGSIVDIKDGVNTTTNNIDREFVATSYVAVQDGEGAWTYKLASINIVADPESQAMGQVEGSDGTVTRSIAEVAYQMVNDETRNPEDETVARENASLNETYLDKCQYEIVVKQGETELVRENVRYGSSYNILSPTGVTEKYRVRNVATIKDSNENVVSSTNIAKVTASETYTIEEMHEEYVLMDMTDGTNVLTPTTNAGNKAKWSVSTTVKYPGEDASLKLLGTGDLKDTYNYLDRDQLMLFDEWVVRFRVAEDYSSWGCAITLKLGNSTFKDERTAVRGWREFRVVNEHDASRTYELFIDGVSAGTGTYGGIAICSFDITLGGGDGYKYDGSAEHALFISDIVGINKQENKEVVIINNGGYDAKGERDIFKLVDTGTTYSKNDLMFGETVRFKRSAYSGTGSYTAGIRDVLMGGKEVVGYKANGNEITASEPYAVNETTIIEPIYDETNSKANAVVLSNFETASLVETDGSPDDGVAETSDYIKDANSKKIFAKAAHGTTQLSIADRTFHSQTKMLKVVRTDGEYMNMQLRFASAWYNNAAYTFRIEWDELAAAAPLWELAGSDITAPKGSTGCTVLVKVTNKNSYAADIYLGFSTQEGLTKVGSTSGLPNYFEIMLRGQNTPWYFSNVYGIN